MHTSLIQAVPNFIHATHLSIRKPLSHELPLDSNIAGTHDEEVSIPLTEKVKPNNTDDSKSEADSELLSGIVI